MKSVYSLFLAVIININLVTAANAESCVDNYPKSYNPDVVWAGTFLDRALDDTDWMTMKIVISDIRRALRYPAWEGSREEDPLNFVVRNIILSEFDKFQRWSARFCGSEAELWTMQKITAYLILEVEKKKLTY